MSIPNIDAVPPVGSISVVNILIRVVFPEPFRPNSPKIPVSIESETLFNAVTLLLYFLVKLEVSIIIFNSFQYSC